MNFSYLQTVIFDNSMSVHEIALEFITYYKMYCIIISMTTFFIMDLGKSRVELIAIDRHSLLSVYYSISSSHFS